MKRRPLLKSLSIVGIACVTSAAPTLDEVSRELGEELVAAMDAYLADGTNEGIVIPWQEVAISNTLKGFVAAGLGDIDAASAWLDKALAAFEVECPLAHCFSLYCTQVCFI